jgi:branched-chain amino acid transport system substrate-binding protein
MNKATKTILGLVILIIIVLAIYYGVGKKPTIPTTKEKIKIGAILSLTGYAAGYGDYAKKAIELAASEINKNGGINGRKVEVIFEDDHTQAQDAVSAFLKLVNVDKVDGIIGSLWDFTTQPLIPLAKDYKITLITPTNFRIKGSFETNEYSFTMLPSFEKVLKVVEICLKKEGVKKLGVVRFASSFGEEIKNVLSEIMKNYNGTEVIDESYNEIGNNDFRTTILKLKEKRVDAVFIDMVDKDMENFLKRAKELDFRAKIITHVAILDLISNPNIDKNLLEGIVFVNWEVQPEAFSKKFEEFYKIKPAKSADRSYDALYVLFDAISNSKDSVNKYIEKNKFTTVNGTIVFNENHEVENLPVSLQLIKDGKIVDYNND